MKRTLIIKKDGTLQNYDPKKILIAIGKSAARVQATLSEEQQKKIISMVESYIEGTCKDKISVSDMHTIVELALEKYAPVVCNSYREYRNFKKQYAEDFADGMAKAHFLYTNGSKENSNADSTLVSTKRTLMANVFNEKRYYRTFLFDDEMKAQSDGYIYIHDKSARLDTMNCCLFDMAAVLKDGFEMSNVWYNEPKRLDTAFDVMGDVILMSASQQYGGFTVPEIDKTLEPYAQKSYDMYLQKYLSLGVADDKARVQAEKDVEKDMEGGFQGIEYKLNTVASSRGDYPFVTVSFGLATSKWGKCAAKWCLRVRKGGQGKAGYKKPVLFPKLVFLYDENIHGKGKISEDLFEEGIACSAKTMYPDWLSLSGDGYVANIYQKYGRVISPMGCRAFLSPWYERGGGVQEDETDKPVYVGRFNIGAISLHLPLILAKAREEDRSFYDVLDEYLQMIRRIHIRTYEYLGKMSASCNPLAYCEGGFLGGHLKFDDKIEPILKSSTASFGITALNELQELYNGKSLVEDGGFALSVMKYINQKVNEFKEEDGYLYAIYGTPAENLCGKQVEQFRKLYGVVEGVSDRAYVSNSFHCHVTEDISPIQKQDLEGRFWNYCNGGKIQYVRYPIGYNVESIRVLVRRAMELGFYEGVNLSLSYCDDCGHEELEMDVCPICGSSHLTKIDRMNGYLSYSRVRGHETRLAKHKMIEIAERKSM